LEWSRVEGANILWRFSKAVCSWFFIKQQEVDCRITAPCPNTNIKITLGHFILKRYSSRIRILEILLKCLWHCSFLFGKSSS
jgi:hypothetical protein